MKNLKQILFSAALALAAFTTNAQVKIGKNPTAIATDVNLHVEATNAQHVVITKSKGDVGIGTASPTSKLRVIDSTLNDSRTFGYYVSTYLKPEPTTQYIVGDYSEIFTLPTDAADHTYMNAKHTRSFHNGTGTLIDQRGYAAVARNKGSGTVSNQYALNTDNSNDGDGNVGYSIGLFNQIVNSGSGIISNAVGYKMRIYNTSSGTITNGYGILIDSINATNRWSIYSSTNAPSYFEGHIGIGTNSPLRRLHVVGSDGLSGSTYASVGARDNFLLENNVNSNMGLLGPAGIGESTIKFYRSDVVNDFGYVRMFRGNNNRLEIGNNQTTNPNNHLVLVDNGLVGIGAINPVRRLHVVGAGGLTGSSYSSVGGADNLLLENNGNSNIGLLGSYGNSASAIKFYRSDATNDMAVVQLNRTADNRLEITNNFLTNPTGHLVLVNGGLVGIGTAAPTVKLDVQGYIKLASVDAAGDATPSPGMIRYNSTTDKFEGYTTTGWVSLN
jgi:hypothetical protein